MLDKTLAEWIKRLTKTRTCVHIRSSYLKADSGKNFWVIKLHKTFQLQEIIFHKRLSQQIAFYVKSWIFRAEDSNINHVIEIY